LTQQPHLQDNTQAWVWKAVSPPNTANKKQLAMMDVRTVFLLKCSFYFFIADLLTLLLIGAVNRWALSAFRNLLTNGLSPRMPIK
jgi:hypothetical protein